MNNERKKLIGLIGLSRELRLPTKWLKQQAVIGAIPCLRVGRRTFFSVSAVEQAIVSMAERQGVGHAE
jgi:hypothetical protein